MQAAYRGHLVRKALRGLSDGAKQTALADLRRHKSEHEELKRRNNAALRIQRVARYQLAILEKAGAAGCGDRRQARDGAHGDARSRGSSRRRS